MRFSDVALQFVNPAVSIIPELIVPTTCFLDNMLPRAAALATLEFVETMGIQGIL